MDEPWQNLIGLLGHMLRDWTPRTTAKVQDVGSWREFPDENIMPDLVVPIAVLAIGVPIGSMSLVMPDDPIC